MLMNNVLRPVANNLLRVPARASSGVCGAKSRDVSPLVSLLSNFALLVDFPGEKVVAILKIGIWIDEFVMSRASSIIAISNFIEFDDSRIDFPRNYVTQRLTSIFVILHHCVLQLSKP